MYSIILYTHHNWLVIIFKITDLENFRYKNMSKLSLSNDAKPITSLSLSHLCCLTDVYYLYFK